MSDAIRKLAGLPEDTSPENPIEGPEEVAPGPRTDVGASINHSARRVSKLMELFNELDVSEAADFFDALTQRYEKEREMLDNINVDAMIEHLSACTQVLENATGA